MPNTGPDLKTVLDVLARDGHACTLCGRSVRGDRGYAWSIHHRKARGMGGRAGANQPSNLLTVCGSGTDGCHGRIESRRAEALELGFLVSRYSDPAQVAVEIRGRRFVYLGDDAQYHDAPAVTV